VLDSHGPFEEVENILLRHAPEGNFEITTRVLFTPYSNFQSAGLIVYQDDNAALFFRRAMCYLPSVPGLCVGNGLYFDNYNKDEGTPEMYYQIGPNFATQTINPDEVLLRLTREGRVYTAYYSSDGENWITVGRHEANLFPFYVGLIASGALEHPAEADFDYFTLEILP
jgi:regulation of enolase protein 1 (concanavalin A-like superfamily)